MTWYYTRVCSLLCSVASVMSNSLWPHRLQSVRLLCPWDSPGKNTGVGCHALLQGIFLTQGLYPHVHLLHCRLIFLPLRHRHYTEKILKNATKKLLELINEFSKVIRYKINTQKSLEFLYTNNEKSEREIKVTIPFTIATKRIKYLGINLPKETKDLYAGTSKTLMKEIKDNKNR